MCKPIKLCRTNKLSIALQPNNTFIKSLRGKKSKPSHFKPPSVYRYLNFKSHQQFDTVVGVWFPPSTKKKTKKYPQTHPRTLYPNWNYSQSHQENPHHLHFLSARFVSAFSFFFRRPTAAIGHNPPPHHHDFGVGSENKQNSEGRAEPDQSPKTVKLFFRFTFFIFSFTRWSEISLC